MIQIIVVTVIFIVGAALVTFVWNENSSNDTAEVIETEVSLDSKNSAVTDVKTSPDESDEVVLKIDNENTLDLSGSSLYKVPSAVFNKINIQELNLSNNNLEGALPAEIRFLQNLKSLNLSNNNFTGVPAEIGQLSKLEILNLSNNKLTGLPHELGNLSNLKLLDLRGNTYSKQDLDIIKINLSGTVNILVD